jgi:HAD superfamily hydrolase (TIGR01509 family)
MKIASVIFDMDGLMADTEPLYSEAAIIIAKRRGKEFTLSIKQEMMGRVGTESMRIFKERLGLSESVEELLTERAEIYDKILTEERIRPMPGLFNLLDLLSELNLPLAVASSSKRRWIERILSSLNIKKRFCVIVSAEDVVNGKPDPEIYLKTAKRLGIPIDRCLVLEDAPSGLIAAKRAGAKCIIVRNQFTRDLDFSEADIVVDSLLAIEREMLRRI